MGFATALTGRFDLTAPWLVIAYVLVAFLVVAGILYFAPKTERLAKALEASPDRFSPELEALLEPRRQLVAAGLDVLV